MKLENIKCLLAVCLCASALLVGCGQKTDSKTADKSETSSESAQNQLDDIQEASRDVFAMDTYMTVTAYGENAEAAVDAAQAEIERLDALLSRRCRQRDRKTERRWKCRAFRRCRLFDGTRIGTLSGDRWYI